MLTVAVQLSAPVMWRLSWLSCASGSRGRVLVAVVLGLPLCTVVFWRHRRLSSSGRFGRLFWWPLGCGCCSYLTFFGCFSALFILGDLRAGLSTRWAEAAARIARFEVASSAFFVLGDFGGCCCLKRFDNNSESSIYRKCFGRKLLRISIHASERCSLS